MRPVERALQQCLSFIGSKLSLHAATPDLGRATMSPPVPVSAIMHHASKMLKRASELSAAVAGRRFRALIGVSPAVCATVWSMLRASLPPKASPAHLLWALLFLKVYATEHTSSIIAGADEKTFRKWSWAFAQLISNLRVVSRLNFFKHPHLIAI